MIEIIFQSAVEKHSTRYACSTAPG